MVYNAWQENHMHVAAATAREFKTLFFVSRRLPKSAVQRTSFLLLIDGLPICSDSGSGMSGPTIRDTLVPLYRYQQRISNHSFVPHIVSLFSKAVMTLRDVLQWNVKSKIHYKESPASTRSSRTIRAVAVTREVVEKPNKGAGTQWFL